MHDVGIIIITWYVCQAYNYTTKAIISRQMFGYPPLSLFEQVAVGLLWPRIWWRMRKIR